MTTRSLCSQYTSPVFHGDPVFFKALLDPETREKRQLEVEFDVLWAEHVDGQVRRIDLDCPHQETYWPDNAVEISRIVNGLLTDLNSGADS